MKDQQTPPAYQDPTTDLDAVAALLPACVDIRDGSERRRAAWHALRDAAPAMVAELRWLRWWQAEALRVGVPSAEQQESLGGDRKAERNCVVCGRSATIAISGGQSSTTAYKDSTEADQFH